MEGGPLGLLGLHRSQPQIFFSPPEADVLASAVALVLIHLEKEGSAETAGIKSDNELLARMLGGDGGDRSPEDIQRRALLVVQGLSQIDPAKVQRAIGVARTHSSLFGDSPEVVARLRQVLEEGPVVRPRLPRFAPGVARGRIGATPPPVPNLAFFSERRLVGNATGAKEGIALIRRVASSVIDALEPRGKIMARIQGPKKPAEISIQLSNGVVIFVRADSSNGAANATPTRLYVRINYANGARAEEFRRLRDQAFERLAKMVGVLGDSEKKPQEMHRLKLLASMEGFRLGVAPSGDGDKLIFASVDFGGRLEIAMSNAETRGSWLMLELSPRAIPNLSIRDRYTDWLTMFLQTHAEIFNLLSVPPPRAEEAS